MRSIPSRLVSSCRWMALAAAASLACGGDGGGGGPIGPQGPPDLSQSQSIQGTFDYESITIPAGVTITASGDLTLNSTGPVQISGTLTGNCVTITVNGQAALTVSGRVSNACSTPPANADAPALTLVGNGDVVFDGAQVSSSGDITVKNNPALTEADFPEASVPADRLVPAQVRVFDIRNASEFSAPGPAADGAEGTDTQGGGRGRRGARFTFFSDGDLNVDASTIEGQDGGDGGDHTRTASGNATADGGDGADGGDVRILARGRVTIGALTEVSSGDGGNGGDGTATSTNGTGARAGSATATGGDGGEAGLLRIEGQSTGIAFGPGARVRIGKGGDGGTATAKGADGSICVEGHGQHGGHATATGGDGADSPEGRMRLRGNVVGAPALVGADAGHGGDATATAGKGKDGENCEDCKDGGDGGNATANGGDGGDAQLRNLANQVVGRGGDGGKATLSSGNGGTGFSCCEPQPEEGGDGGDGGDAAGSDGEPGTGAQNGTARGVTITNHGNGGDGGDGIPVGDGGAAGADGTGATGPKSVQSSFQPGDDGDPCPTVIPPQLSQIQGSYLVTGDRISLVGDCEFSESVEFPVDILVGSGPTITVRTFGSPDVPGTYDPATGNWTGTATSEPDDEGEQVRETWEGRWFVAEDGTVIFQGTVLVEILDAQGNVRCSARFQVRAERKGAAFTQVVGFIEVRLLPNTNGVVQPGRHTVPIVNVETSSTLGTVPLETGGPSGNHFVGDDPPRFGLESPGFWILHWADLVLNGTTLKPQFLVFCLPPGAMTPSVGIEVAKFDNSTELGRTPFSPTELASGCQFVVVPQDVDRVEIRLMGDGVIDLQPFTAGTGYGDGYDY